MQKNLSREVLVLDSSKNALAVELLQMIIEETQQKKYHYKYAVLSLTFNFLLFFDRLNTLDSGMNFHILMQWIMFERS